LWLWNKWGRGMREVQHAWSKWQVHAKY
jgi:hypothetical protein